MIGSIGIVRDHKGDLMAFSYAIGCDINNMVEASAVLLGLR